MKFGMRSLSAWIVFGLIIGAGIFAAGCLQAQDPGTPGTGHLEPAPAPPIARPPSLGVNATPIWSSYLPGEEVEVRISLMNDGADTLTVRSFPPRVSLTNPTRGVVQNFSHGNETITLAPGESTGYILRWDQRDGDGEQVCPGYYLVEVADIRVEGTGTGVLYPEGIAVAQVLIRYPQGAMEKNVSVNQSKSVDGLTVGLENITFSSIGAQARALVQLPSEPERRSDMPAPSPTPPDINPSAYYRLDGGPEKEFVRVGFKVVDDGTVLAWDFEPVPVDTGNISIVITRLGTWEGPCEFHVDLSEDVSFR